MANDMITVLKKVAYELREEKLELQQRIAANRRSLRDLATQGLLSEDDEVWLEEFYPPRSRKAEVEA